MPIYEYQCQACQKQIEVLQKINDAPLIDCPQCGKPALKKQVSAATFRLKGGGWYETDFKTGNKKNLVSGGDSAGGSGDKSTASSSGESKSGESKSGESKASESKASAGKSSESKSGESKKTA
jgi:putative FmdB family regulatory protein